MTIAIKLQCKTDFHTDIGYKVKPKRRSNKISFTQKPYFILMISCISPRLYKLIFISDFGEIFKK